MSKTPVPDPDQPPVMPEPVPAPYPCALYHPTDASSPRLVADAAAAQLLEAEGWSRTPPGAVAEKPVEPVKASTPDPEAEATFAADLAANEAAADKAASTKKGKK